MNGGGHDVARSEAFFLHVPVVVVWIAAVQPVEIPPRRPLGVGPVHVPPSGADTGDGGGTPSGC